MRLQKEILPLAPVTFLGVKNIEIKIKGRGEEGNGVEEKLTGKDDSPLSRKIL